jgi:hypothetical protein
VENVEAEEIEGAGEAGRASTEAGKVKFSVRVEKRAEMESSACIAVDLVSSTEGSGTEGAGTVGSLGLKETGDAGFEELDLGSLITMPGALEGADVLTGSLMTTPPGVGSLLALPARLLRALASSSAWRRAASAASAAIWASTSP